MTYYQLLFGGLEDDDIRSNFAKESWRDPSTLYEPYNFDYYAL